MDHPPAKRVYGRKEILEKDLSVSTDDSMDSEPESDTDDNQSIMSDTTECSLIGTTYKKNRHLKELDTELKDTLFSKGFDTQDKVAAVFSTLRDVNPRYGLPILEQRSERRLEDFYKDTITNLG